MQKLIKHPHGLESQLITALFTPHNSVTYLTKHTVQVDVQDVEVKVPADPHLHVASNNESFSFL